MQGNYASYFAKKIGYPERTKKGHCSVMQLKDSTRLTKATLSCHLRDCVKILLMLSEFQQIN